MLCGVLNWFSPPFREVDLAALVYRPWLRTLFSRMNRTKLLAK